MNIKNALDFLEELKKNNNRDWFNAHKERYLVIKAEFEQLTETLIDEISKFDKSIVGLSAKDCIFRIYRDTRFAYDKTPYKTHFGTYIAAKEGRRSEHAGYYLHIDPDGPFFSCGVWQPDKVLLRHLRTSIYDNYDEWNDIISENNFVNTFDERWYEQDMLKTVPRQFPKDAQSAYFLRLRHYLVSKNFTIDEIQVRNLVHNLVEIARVGEMMNRFLNFTVDEFGF